MIGRERREGGDTDRGRVRERERDGLKRDGWRVGE